jgi:hypothetical protein
LNLNLLFQIALGASNIVSFTQYLPPSKYLPYWNRTTHTFCSAAKLLGGYTCYSNTILHLHIRNHIYQINTRYINFVTTWVINGEDIWTGFKHRSFDYNTNSDLVTKDEYFWYLNAGSNTAQMHLSCTSEQMDMLMHL